MRAAVFTTPGEVEVAEVPDPAPAADEVVIDVAAVGICGTDLHILDGDFNSTLPIVPGHEFAGVVMAVGSEVSTLTVGDRVGVDPSHICGRCRPCRRGRTNLCEVAGGYGTTWNGGAAEFAAIRERHCVRLPDSIETGAATLIEPLSCAIRGYDVARASIGDRALIYGAGTMGLMMLQLAKLTGLAEVHVVDISTDRLVAATELGCTSTATSADDLPHRSWDLVIDASGSAAAIQDGIPRVERGGTYLQFGVPPSATQVVIEPYRIYHEEITVTGSMATLNSYARAVDLFATGAIDPSFFISDRFPLAEYPAALEAVRAGAGRKVQVLP
ncbi:alcohol dehydrogenase [Enemella evansiae]|uniref:Alcohol dehydrogenase n=1 Tax=Enemella evansiae TaxID=2016499 RepID=A0A255G3U1_9ACTN|nr:zinc-dependent alcohol dehydrogenase family protein [Enemella evansiae]OYO10580.1 alcohol dehydrogenase [Enemella evansiae]